MLTIYKYPVPVEDSFTLDLPEGFRVLAIQEQHGAPQLWAMVDADGKKQPEQFALRGTGHNCDGLGFAEHVGTFQLSSGALVFHVFHLRSIR